MKPYFFCLLTLGCINLNAQHLGLVLDNFSHRNGSVGSLGLFDNSAFSESGSFSLSSGLEFGLPLDSSNSIIVQAIFRNSQIFYNQESSSSPTFLESFNNTRGVELNGLLQRVISLPSNRVNIQYAIGLTASMDFGRNSIVKQTNFSEDSITIFQLERVTNYPSDWSYGILMRTGFGIHLGKKFQIVPHISLRLLYQTQKGAIKSTVNRTVFDPDQITSNTLNSTPIRNSGFIFSRSLSITFRYSLK